MIPYTSFLYFGILLIYIAIPAIIVGFFKRISKIWLVIATLAMLVIQYLFSTANHKKHIGQ